MTAGGDLVLCQLVFFAFFVIRRNYPCNRALIKCEQFEKDTDSQMNVIWFKEVFYFFVEKESCLWYTINT